MEKLMEMVGGLAALIGLDWADQKHDVCLLDLETGDKEAYVIDQTPEDIEEWATSLRMRFGGRPVGICVEQTRGALVYALMKYEFMVLFPVNPKTTKKFRDAIYPSGAKSDPADAELHLELLMKHPERLRVWEPDTEQTRLIQGLVEDRRKAVDVRTGFTNALRAAVKQYFPQAIEWSGAKFGIPMTCNFLLKWPTLLDVKRAKPETVRRFFHANGCRRGDLIEKRIEAINGAIPLVTDEAIIEISVMRVKMLAELILKLHAAIDAYDRRLKDAFNIHPDAYLYENLPHAGTQTAPRLLAAFGSNRERFDSANSVSCLYGIAPVMITSGHSKLTCWRRACPKFTRQSFHEWAALSRRSSKWASAYYDQQRDKGVGHHAAIRSLAFKWIRILYACWRDRTPYCEEQYLEALRRSGSPLVALIEAA